MDINLTDEDLAIWLEDVGRGQSMEKHYNRAAELVRRSADVDGGYDQTALDAASREVHMMLLREGSSWGTKACEEMGRVFMTAYRTAMRQANSDGSIP